MNRHNIDEVKGVFGSSIPTSREAFFTFILKHMDEADLLTLHNDGYCNYYQDDYIYDNDEYNFNEWLGDRTPYEVAIYLSGTRWKDSDKYFTKDQLSYGITSFNDLHDVISLGALAEFCIDNPNYIWEYVNDSDIILAFGYYAQSLTDEEIGNIDAETLVCEDWDDVIEEIINNR